MSFIDNFAVKVGLRERRKNGRMPTTGLEAFYSDGGEKRPAAIRNISPNGICLISDNRFSPGARVMLTLRRKIADDSEFGSEISMPAKVARAGEQDAGLEFIHEHINAAGWSKLVLEVAGLPSRNDGVRVFRIARALAFLRQISPAAEAQFRKDISDGMSHDGTERAIEVVLKAEELLSSRGQTPRTGVDVNLIQRIIDRGANIDAREGEMARCWAGLLASATLDKAGNEIGLDFVDMLSKLNLAAMRILSAGCLRARAVGWGAGFAFQQSILSGADELRKSAGARDMMSVEWGLNQLHGLGLLQHKLAPATYEPVTHIDITPTGLGLKLHARCQGLLEVPETLPGSGSAA